MKLDLVTLRHLKGRLENVSYDIRKVIFGGVKTDLMSIFDNVQSDNLNYSIRRITDEIDSLSNGLNEDFYKLIQFMDNQLKSYTATNEEAKARVERLIELLNQTFDENGNILAPASTVINTLSLNSGSNIDLSVYTNAPEKGFTVSDNNQTYSLTDSEKHFMYSVVAAEAINDYDDALAVSSVILNRCESNDWALAENNTPIGQLKRKGQFEAYAGGNGTYLKYYNNNVEIPETIKRAVDDALNGVRNCEYLSFNAAYSKGYNGKQIVKGGNQFK